MIKLIIFDLDGTVIDVHNHCDPSVADAIRQYRQYGIRFSVCSGRNCESILPLLKQWGLDGNIDFLIGSNGGQVWDLTTGNTYDNDMLDRQVMLDILDEYEPLGLIPTLYCGEDLYVQKINEHVETVGNRVGVNLIEADVRAQITGPAFKEMFILDRADMKEVEAYAKAHPDPRFICFKTAVDLFEMTNPRLSKRTGVERISQLTGIRPEEMMAFGDTTNDIPMLQYVKYGIVMDNGSTDAKEAAYAIAPSVDDRGFAVYLHDHLNGNELI